MRHLFQKPVPTHFNYLIFATELFNWVSSGQTFYYCFKYLNCKIWFCPPSDYLTIHSHRLVYPVMQDTMDSPHTPLPQVNQPTCQKNTLPHPKPLPPNQSVLSQAPWTSSTWYFQCSHTLSRRLALPESFYTNHPINVLPTNWPNSQSWQHFPSN